MNHILQQIIQYKTDGRQTAFAELMGWKTPYLNKLVKGINFGLQPVLAILERFPEIDARWLLLGEGTMLSDAKEDELRREALNYAQEVLELERFIRVMSPEELRRYEECVTGRRMPDFSPETVSRWESILNERESAIKDRVSTAMNKSDEICRQRTARK